MKPFWKINKPLSPIILGLAAGLYPILFYYSQNYYLINTGRHLLFFVALFLGGPIALFLLARFVLKSKSESLQEKVYTFLSLSCFGIFLQLCLYTSLRWLLTLFILFFASILVFLAYRRLKQFVTLQFLLAVVALFSVIPVLLGQLKYSEAWMDQPDDIEAVLFKKRPNIYFIQPDGYVNFSEINKGHYQFDNSQFASFLSEKKFTMYPNARSNYSTTLTSNSAIFSMKHHYYNNGFNFKERLDMRKVIISDNAVLRVLKNNNYKTHYLAEWAYLLTNRPEMGYDACNFSYDEIPLLSTGFDEIREVQTPLSRYMDEDRDQSKFFFIELFLPGHIATNAAESTGAEKEKEWWISNLKAANEKLEAMVSLIEEKDPSALIVMMSDHGGYVGMEYMRELGVKTQNRDKLYSGFSTILAVKWPDYDAPKFDKKLKTGVNLFRVLFSYLGEDESYLDHLQNDGSYHIVNKNAVKGVYKYIDEAGEIVFERQN